MILSCIRVERDALSRVGSCQFGSRRAGVLHMGEGYGVYGRLY